MEGTESLKERMAPWLKKVMQYRYALLVALLGIALMLLPGRDVQSATPAEQPTESQWQGEAELCRELEELLSQIEGAGRVSCLLTYSEGVKAVYQMDLTQTGDGEVKQNTVLVSTGSGTETAVKVGTLGPVYQGVVVVCEGADSAKLQLEIIKSVRALTGLSSDKIAVVKRKGTT